MPVHTDKKQRKLFSETKNKVTIISLNFRQMTRSNFWTVSLSMAASQADETVAVYTRATKFCCFYCRGGGQILSLC